MRRARNILCLRIYTVSQFPKIGCVEHIWVCCSAPLVSPLTSAVATDSSEVIAKNLDKGWASMCTKSSVWRECVVRAHKVAGGLSGCRAVRTGCLPAETAPVVAVLVGLATVGLAGIRAIMVHTCSVARPAHISSPSYTQGVVPGVYGLPPVRRTG